MTSPNCKPCIQSCRQVYSPLSLGKHRGCGSSSPNCTIIKRRSRTPRCNWVKKCKPDVSGPFSPVFGIHRHHRNPRLTPIRRHTPRRISPYATTIIGRHTPRRISPYATTVIRRRTPRRISPYATTVIGRGRGPIRRVAVPPLIVRRSPLQVIRR